MSEYYSLISAERDAGAHTVMTSMIEMIVYACAQMNLAHTIRERERKRDYITHI